VTPAARRLLLAVLGAAVVAYAADRWPRLGGMLLAVIVAGMLVEAARRGRLPRLA